MKNALGKMKGTTVLFIPPGNAGRVSPRSILLILLGALVLSGCSLNNDNDTEDDPPYVAPIDAATPVIGTQPAAASIYNWGNPVTPLSVRAGKTDAGTLSYQWYSNATESTAGATPITGNGNGNTYTPPTPAASPNNVDTFYYVVVTNTNTSATGAQTASAQSSFAKVTFTNTPVTHAAPPTITAQPVGDETYAPGDAATPLTVTAATNDSGTLLYQWFSNTANNTSEGNPVGTNAASFTPPTTNSGTLYYYVVVINTNTAVNGNQTASVTSSTVAITVNPKTITITDIPAEAAGTYYLVYLRVSGSDVPVAASTGGPIGAGVTSLTGTMKTITLSGNTFTLGDDWTGSGSYHIGLIGASKPIVSANQNFLFRVELPVTSLNSNKTVSYNDFAESDDDDEELRPWNSCHLRINNLPAYAEGMYYVAYLIDPEKGVPVAGYKGGPISAGTDGGLPLLVETLKTLSRNWDDFTFGDNWGERGGSYTIGIIFDYGEIGSFDKTDWGASSSGLISWSTTDYNSVDYSSFTEDRVTPAPITAAIAGKTGSGTAADPYVVTVAGMPLPVALGAIYSGIITDIPTGFISLNLDSCTGTSVGYTNRITDAEKARFVSITLPATVSVITDGFKDADWYSGAFSSFTGLKSINAPGVITVGDHAFSGLTSLETVSLPTASAFGDYTFIRCTSLKTVSLPAATTFEDLTFYGCTSLKTVSLPAATTFGEETFRLHQPYHSEPPGGNYLRRLYIRGLQ
ncbi:leucine-rich repeat domain-containing protein [Treponema primitia]|uniref:leucine-rich repeat domain-containing protein n=1 Tax=Treponema primitia TaxID=88058 RepID=UPI0002FF052C|nr:leucine-rich repeat domain-containing protein [Treponema primitia]